ncbi:hypothetical protein CFC21_045061 [Triticum aestivum]|uniref:Uncharacterized protein n=2 Tax=Triticum aestivum TaxID=4565 RepID=A0A3B6G2S6_WHEAT|nr:interaptin-like [Triticum aestivum]KAF7034002.1 hypothetical protein CFC21_045061 [Triticum aestivum]
MTDMSSPTAPWFADLFTDVRVRTLSHQVTTLGDSVWELEGKITQLICEKGKLEKQLEETKAISSHKEEVERSFKAENDKLRSEVSIAEEKCGKSEAEVERLSKELGALAEAKEGAAKEFNDERAKIWLESENLKRRLEQIQAIKDLAESENDKLRSEALIAKEKQNMSEAEIEMLKIELGGLAEAKAFDVKNAELTEELEELKRKLKEIQTNKDLVDGENDKLRSEVFTAEEKCGQSEAEVKCLKQVVGALVEAKEAAAKAFEAEKVEIMKEMDNLKRTIEEIQANKDSVESQNHELQSKILIAEQENSVFKEEVKSLKVELGAVQEAKEVYAKEFDAEKVEILKELDDLKGNLEEYQVNKDLLEAKNDKLQLEVFAAEQKQSMSEADAKSLKMELVALVEAKEAATKAFDAEKAKITKDLEVLKWKVEEIQTKKDLVEGEKDKLRLEILIAEQKHAMSELEVKRLKMDLTALAEAKEAAVKSFDAEKVKFMKEVESLKRKIEEIHASKEAVVEAGYNKDVEADRLKDELVKIRVSVSQLQASCIEIDAKHSCLNDEMNSVQKALVSEKVEGNKLKLKIEELQNYIAEKDGENGKLKAALEEKKSEIDALSKDKEQLHLIVAKAHEKNKCSILSFLSPCGSK